MGRSQFTFYESFARALGRIRKKADRADAYDAICNYALYGTEPDLNKLPDAAAIAFDLIRPTLDASKRKAESGKRGGNQKQTGSKGEANGKQNETKPEANGKREQSGTEKEKEKEIENECSPSLYLPHEGNKSKPEAETGTVVYPPVKGPTLDQVREYARMRRSQADPRAFFDYYAAAGWRDREGKPVFNWQQTFIAWELRQAQRGGKSGSRSGGTQSLSCMDKDRDLTQEEADYRDKVLEMRRHMEEQRARKKAAAGGGEG